MSEIEGLNLDGSIKKAAGRPRKDPWNQGNVDKIETAQLFSELPTGFQVKIYRKSPEWASGYLGEVFQTEDSPISIENLKSRFGGQILVIQVVDEKGVYRSQKTIKINDVPKVDYKPVNIAYASTGIMHEVNANGTSSHPAPGTQAAGQFPGQMMPGQMMPGMMQGIPPGLPPKLQNQVMAHMFGFSLPEQQEKKSDNPMDIMQQKMMMDMMSQSTTNQSSQMQATMEMNRDMMRMRREWEKDSEPKVTPMESMNSTMQMLREIKSMQGEFGGGGDNVVAEITSQAIPAIESLLGEIISLKKVSMQVKAAKDNPQQLEHRELPARTQTEPTVIVENKPDPTMEELAAKLGKTYHSLSEEKQQELINIFIAQQPEEIKEENDKNDVIEFENNSNVEHNEEIPPADDILDDEDKELLASGESTGNSNKGEEV
jgi:hypothetical protein